MVATKRVHTKVTRDDWIAAALATLGDRPIDEIRVLSLASTLEVSRSSFYWYFTDVSELRDELLSIWENNTASIVERSERDAATVVAAILGVFECWADVDLYDSQLDLAVREWSRRDDVMAVRQAGADAQRLGSLEQMFLRYGFDPKDSTVRARLLYHSQVGWYALGTDEPTEVRLSYLPYYVEALGGRPPTDDEVGDFKAFLDSTG